MPNGYVMVDGDNTYPAEFAPEMCRIILEKKQIWLLATDFHQLILQRINVPFIILAIPL